MQAVKNTTLMPISFTSLAPPECRTFSEGGDQIFLDMVYREKFEEKMTNLPVSAYIICQNEAHVIEKCVRSVAFCAEIIVVDSGSTDATLDILESLRDEGLPLRIIREPWRGFGAQKQFALDQCTQDWCLNIDSDERVSPILAAKFADLISDESVDGWKITRYDYINGYGFVPPAQHERYHYRLFRRGKGRYDLSDLVHESVIVTGVTKKAKPGGLLHFSPIILHDQMLKENKYSSLKAEMKTLRGIPPRPWKMLISPQIFFLRWYLKYGFWRMGWPGFIHCAKGAIYSFLTEAKRYENISMKRIPPVEPTEVDRY